MKKIAFALLFLGFTSLFAQEDNVHQIKDDSADTTAPKAAAPAAPAQACGCHEMAKPEMPQKQEPVLDEKADIRISVVGEGVSPATTTSPAQAYALAKRAAIADAYRLIAEKVKGVRVEGQDLIQNMMVKRSTVRTSVNAMIRDANIVETTFKEGLCEVEMEIVLSYAQFAR